MKIKHITQYLFESFKDAQVKFAQEASEEEVKRYLDTFKQLAKKGTANGEQKDIGYWIKQGWNSFKEFVDSKSQEKSKSEIKKSKKKDSIIAHEDDDKMVVIPLTKDASCYYGKNTKWCTAGDEDNKFNEYFYIQNVVLFYVIMKNTGEKYSIAYETEIIHTEFYDELDKHISGNEFENKTGIDTSMMVDLYEKYENIIKQAMFINNAPEDVQLEILSTYPIKIRDIKNPSYKLKMKAVEGLGNVINYINNPDEELQLAAVESAPNALRYIDNPTEKVIDRAFKLNSLSIQYIDNPSEEMQIEAIKRNGSNIRFLNDPSEKIQFAAVEKEPLNISFIKNPTENVQLYAIQEGWEDIIGYINNPSEKAQLEAIKKYPKDNIIQFIHNPSEKAQLEAIKKGEHFIESIENPTDKVKKLHNELWKGK